MIEKVTLHWNEPDHFMTIKYGPYILGGYEHYIHKWQMTKHNTAGYVRAMAARNKKNTRTCK